MKNVQVDCVCDLCKLLPYEYRDQTCFFMHKHLQGPEEAVFLFLFCS